LWHFQTQHSAHRLSPFALLFIVAQLLLKGLYLNRTGNFSINCAPVIRRQ
jgi:hypothetical protein